MAPNPLCVMTVSDMGYWKIQRTTPGKWVSSVTSSVYADTLYDTIFDKFEVTFGRRQAPIFDDELKDRWIEKMMSLETVDDAVTVLDWDVAQLIQKFDEQSPVVLDANVQEKYKTGILLGLLASWSRTSLNDQDILERVNANPSSPSNCIKLAAHIIHGLRIGAKTRGTIDAGAATFIEFLLATHIFIREAMQSEWRPYFLDELFKDMVLTGNGWRVRDDVVPIYPSFFVLHPHFSQSPRGSISVEDEKEQERIRDHCEKAFRFRSHISIQSQGSEDDTMTKLPGQEKGFMRHPPPRRAQSSTPVEAPSSLATSFPSPPEK